MGNDETRRVQEFLDELTKLSKRTGVIVLERYESACLHVTQPGQGNEDARGYIVHHDPSEGIMGKFFDLCWHEGNARDDTRRTAPDAPSVIEDRERSEDESTLAEETAEQAPTALPNGPELSRDERGW